jgi:hypothetical protein
MSLNGEHTDNSDGSRKFVDRCTRGTESVTVSKKIRCKHVRFEVFTAVTMKNGVFLDVTQCGSRNNTSCN